MWVKVLRIEIVWGSLVAEYWDMRDLGGWEHSIV